MSIMLLKLFLSAVPFFKEMIFGKKTAIERVTGFAMFCCFTIIILSMIIFNSFHYNLLLNNKNKELMEEKQKMEQVIKSLEGNKFLKICQDKDVLITTLRTGLEECNKGYPKEKKRIEDMKNALKKMD